MVGFVLGKETNKHRLNLFKKSTMIRKLNWKTNIGEK